MLICSAFGVIAPKVYRGVLKDWSFDVQPGAQDGICLLQASESESSR